MNTYLNKGFYHEGVKSICYTSLFATLSHENQIKYNCITINEFSHNHWNQKGQIEWHQALPYHLRKPRIYWALVIYFKFNWFKARFRNKMSWFSSLNSRGKFWKLHRPKQMSQVQNRRKWSKILIINNKKGGQKINALVYFFHKVHELMQYTKKKKFWWYGGKDVSITKEEYWSTFSNQPLKWEPHDLRYNLSQFALTIPTIPATSEKHHAHYKKCIHGISSFK